MLINHENHDLTKYAGGFEESPLGSLSPQAQIGIVGGFVGVFGLATLDALLFGIGGELALLPEIGAIGAVVLGAKYYLKKKNINFMEYLKSLNWDALLPGYEPPTVEGTIVEEVPAQDAPRSSDHRIVDLGDCLQLDIDDLIGKAIFIFGIRRSGKTTLGVRIAEELGRFNVPMFIPDLKGDWLSCKDTLPNASIIGADTLTRENAKDIGKSILGDRRQLIIDIASFDDMNDAGYILAEMIDGLFAWERAHPDRRIPVAVFLDEAQSYLPQDMSQSIIPDKDIRNRLLSRYARVTAVGGSLGLFPIGLSQRIGQTNKQIMAQSELLFLLKQRNHNDLDLYEKFITILTPQEVLGLGKGQGVFVAEDGSETLVQFHRRRSDDSRSRTPKIGDLEAATDEQPGRDEKIVEDEEDYLEEDFIEEEDEIEELSERERQYSQVLDCWARNIRSIRSIMPEMGLNFNQTRELLEEMDDQGLIAWRKNGGV